jgi:hypothetical protein
MLLAIANPASNGASLGSRLARQPMVASQQESENLCFYRSRPGFFALHLACSSQVTLTMPKETMTDKAICAEGITMCEQNSDGQSHVRSH